jgi:hypothetical protein
MFFMFCWALVDKFNFLASTPCPFFLFGLYELLLSVVRSERRFPPVLEASRLWYFLASAGSFGEGLLRLYEISSMLSMSERIRFSPEF